MSRSNAANLQELHPLVVEPNPTLLGAWGWESSDSSPYGQFSVSIEQDLEHLEKQFQDFETPRSRVKSIR